MCHTWETCDFAGNVGPEARFSVKWEVLWIIWRQSVFVFTWILCRFPEIFGPGWVSFLSCNQSILEFCQTKTSRFFFKEETVYTSKQLWKSWFIYSFDIFLCLFGLPPSPSPAKKHAVNSQTEEFTYGGGKWAKLGFMMLTAKRVDWADTNAKLKEPVVERMFFLGKQKIIPKSQSNLLISKLLRCFFFQTAWPI